MARKEFAHLTAHGLPAIDRLLWRIRLPVNLALDRQHRITA